MGYKSSTITRGAALYDQMKDFDYGPVLTTAARSRPDLAPAQIEVLLNAYLQWVAALSTLRANRALIMLDSDIEDVCHAFVLNTRLYHVFCKRFLGFFLHHDPVETPPDHSDEQVLNTLDVLDAEFGESLQPALAQWRSSYSARTYQVACKGWCR